MLNNLVICFDIFFSIFKAVIEIIGLLERQSPLFVNIILGLGGYFTTLFFDLKNLWHNHNNMKGTLHYIKENSKNGIVLLNNQQISSWLGSYKKYLLKQPGRIQNSNNNIEGYCQYKLTEKMKSLLMKKSKIRLVLNYLQK